MTIDNLKSPDLAAPGLSRAKGTAADGASRPAPGTTDLLSLDDLHISVHHGAAGHRPAAYWNLTGHAPPFALENWRASRKDWPCLGSQVARALGPKVPAPFPGTVSLPYPLADAGRANGLDGGFLGISVDPIICRPPEGLPYEGKSEESGTIEIQLSPDVPRSRLQSRY